MVFRPTWPQRSSAALSPRPPSHTKAICGATTAADFEMNVYLDDATEPDWPQVPVGRHLVCVCARDCWPGAHRSAVRAGRRLGLGCPMAVAESVRRSVRCPIGVALPRVLLERPVLARCVQAARLGSP